jgi:hypothetical protein
MAAPVGCNESFGPRFYDVPFAFIALPPSWAVAVDPVGRADAYADSSAECPSPCRSGDVLNRRLGGEGSPATLCFYCAKSQRPSHGSGKLNTKSRLLDGAW